MEKTANYFLVGLSCIALFFAATVFVVWLAKVQFTHDFAEYDVRFQGPVRGLSQGGEVRFNGIKVGDVTKIRLDPRDHGYVLARARVSSDVPIKTDSYATLEPQGFTGETYVQITSGAAASPLLRDTASFGETPVLASRKGSLDSLFEGGGTVMSRAVQALDQVNRVLSPTNVAAIGGILSDTHAVTGELRAHKSMIGDAQKAVQDADVAMARLQLLEASGKSLLDGDARRAIVNAGEAAAELKGTAHELRGMISGLDGPTRDFAANGLPRAVAALAEIQTTSETLNRLMKEVQADPRAFITKTPAKQVTVKP
ncbi:MAG: Mammalian cell entry related domain protein [Caulobacteraceae bacterium]|nr:Mammalian cell entry related domain protein [Caulobacteraceae bacterium]